MFMCGGMLMCGGTCGGMFMCGGGAKCGAVESCSACIAFSCDPMLCVRRATSPDLTKRSSSSYIGCAEGR